MLTLILEPSQYLLAKEMSARLEASNGLDSNAFYILRRMRNAIHGVWFPMNFKPPTVKVVVKHVGEPLDIPWDFDARGMIFD